MDLQLRPALASFLALSAITGLAYPLLVTGAAQLLFRRQAQGSLLVESGQVLGSELIGRAYADPAHFWGRPSATVDADGKPRPYNGANSGGSNLAQGNPDLRKAVEARVAALRAADPSATGPVPVDLVTASGSGLDPHISPAAAAFQVPRVARARGLAAATVQKLVDRHTEGRALGFLGEARVNVQKLNLALDALAR